MFGAAFEHCVTKPYCTYITGVVDGGNFIGSTLASILSVLAKQPNVLMDCTYCMFLYYSQTLSTGGGLCFL